MIGPIMNPEKPLQIILPSEFGQQHYDALIAYLVDSRKLTTAVWRYLFAGINLLDNAQVKTATTTQTFRQIYNQHIDRPFANQYIRQLLETNDVMAESPDLAARHARQIKPILEETGCLRREMPLTILLQGYCLYWWQSFARGYAFELFIMRDLRAEKIDFQMHNMQDPRERYSPADLVVLNMLGDIKTSTYFLQAPLSGELTNDFYITRLYKKGQERTIVVFQKPAAWDMINGGPTQPGSLETILDLLPNAVAITQRGIMLIVVDYGTWKLLVRRQQRNEDA